MSNLDGKKRNFSEKNIIPKTQNIPIKKFNIEHKYSSYDKSNWDNVSRSWNGRSTALNKTFEFGDPKKVGNSGSNFQKSNIANSYSPPSYSKNFYQTDNHDKKYKFDFEIGINGIGRNGYVPYDAISNCKSAGIIPYTIHNGKIYFLLQQIIKPVKKKDFGWNDFGGKQIDVSETTAETAAREFSEETSCLFYLMEQPNDKSIELYNILKDNEHLYYDENTVQKLKDLISESTKYYSNRITEYVLPLYISSKETYISYIVKVEYIPVEDLPRAEDIYIDYDDRYLRTCKWFTFDELMELGEKDFHKRLQITRIQQRLNTYYGKGLFI